MYRLAKEFRFEASHQLKDHDGKCAHLHGHSWRGEIVVGADVLVATGAKRNMVIDYADLAMVTDLIESRFDHQHLNEVTGSPMPTSELICRLIYEMAVSRLAESGVKVLWVSLCETCTTRCEYDGL